ncbi:glycoside hydrolase superfamily [Mycena rosella]|uniref:Glycoside hydrolase superfamily n=1 Tax=Mycena rosella TaxID=1033263 RepID=A0AAD7GCG4_MYCRO|nr:glycoside hydrolase superfamily [Mycena rosella]
MGRCIYSGIYDPEDEHGLADTNGYRTDVLDALKDLKIPIVRYPGGNFLSSSRWQDGFGPKELRLRRLELAWLTEESNQFGTAVHMPQHCMGTGKLEDALASLEYCNSSANTHYANMRRKNGHPEPYGVKYWALGNEIWGPWQVGQMNAEDYGKQAFQWAKALRLLDPSIKLVSCGVYPVNEGNHDVNVMGPAAAEKVIEITKSLIELAKIEGNLTKDIPVCFDEWNVCCRSILYHRAWLC